MLGRLLWNMLTGSHPPFPGGLARAFRLLLRVVALDTENFIMFTFLPGIKRFLHDPWVGQDVAVAAKELGFRNFRLGKGMRCLSDLFRTQ